MTALTIPNQWQALPHQVNLWDAIARDRYRRAVAVWHRRAGKDSTAINLMALKAVTEPGLYYYMAPSQKQARKIIWDNVGRDGLRIINQAFPKQIVKSMNDQEMRIVVESLDGRESIFQVLGSDNYDSIVGSNPRGIVFSEWAIAEKPEAWEYFSPILLENGGFAIFIYTPRGLNHGYRTYNMAMANEHWFCERLTIDDTKLVTPDQIQAERDSGISEMKIQQEYYCAFHENVENQIISGDLIIGAQQRAEAVLEAIKDGAAHTAGAGTWPVDPGAAVVVGVDVARFGDDRTVIATRVGRDFASIPPVILQKKDSHQVAEILHNHLRKYHADACFIDATGMGSGLVDTMKRVYRTRVTGIHFSQRAANDAVYNSIRSEMYSRFNEWLSDPETVLWPNEQLRNEAVAIRFDHDAHDRIRLEPKKETKKRLAVSPDLSDAHALTWAKSIPRRDVWTHQRRPGAEAPTARISW